MTFKKLLGVLICLSVIAGAVATPVTADHNGVSLEDGGIYFQGFVLEKSGFEPGQQLTVEPLEIGSEMSVTADSNGAIEIDTAALYKGEYGLYNANKTELLTFQVAEHVVDAESKGVDVSNGGDTKIATVYLSSNMNRYEVHVESNINNLGDRIEGMSGGDEFDIALSDQSMELKIDVSGLPDGTYDLRFESIHTTGYDTTEITISDETAETKSYPETVPLRNGSSYWIPSTLLYQGSAEKSYLLRTGDGTFESQLAPDANGKIVIDSKSFSPGEHKIVTESGDVPPTWFTLRQQLINLTATNETLEINSNRDGYDAIVRSGNLSSEDLLAAIPATSVADNGDVMLRGLGTNASIAFNRSALPEGNHTIHVSAYDTGTDGAVPVVIEHIKISTPTPTSTPSNKGASVAQATTSTTTISTTVTSTPTATATGTVTTSTSTPAPAPKDSGMSTAEKTGIAGVSVTTVIGALYALKKR